MDKQKTEWLEQNKWTLFFSSCNEIDLASSLYTYQPFPEYAARTFFTPGAGAACAFLERTGLYVEAAPTVGALAAGASEAAGVSEGAGVGEDICFVSDCLFTGCSFGRAGFAVAVVAVLLADAFGSPAAVLDPHL